jgi:hypothetical protein
LDHIQTGCHSEIRTKYPRQRTGTQTNYLFSLAYVFFSSSDSETHFAKQHLGQQEKLGKGCSGIG